MLGMRLHGRTQVVKVQELCIFLTVFCILIKYIQERKMNAQTDINFSRGFPLSQTPVHLPKGCESLNRSVILYKITSTDPGIKTAPPKYIYSYHSLTPTLSVLHITLYNYLLLCCNHVFTSFPFPLDDQQLEAQDNIFTIPTGARTEWVSDKYLMG